MKLLLNLLIVLHQPLGGQRLNTAHSGGDSRLGKDLEGGDAAGVGHMGSAAELCGEIPHLYNAHGVAVLLAEQRHCTCLLGLVQGHHLSLNRKSGPDLLIYQLLHLLQLLGSHCGEMGEVKAQAPCVHVGTGLFYMLAQHQAQRLLKQVGGAVVLTGERAVSGADGQGHGVAALQHAAGHHAHMAYLAALEMDGVLNLELAVLAGDHAHIPLLAAHGAVKRSLLRNHGASLAVGQSLHDLVLRGENRDL